MDYRVVMMEIYLMEMAAHLFVLLSQDLSAMDNHLCVLSIKVLL